MGRVGKTAIIVAIVAIVAIGVASYAFDRYLLGQTYARYSAEEVSLALSDADVSADYPYEDVEFSMDGSTLRGHVYGAGNDRGLIVFRHGIFSQHQDYLALITALVDKDWKVFAYDAIGCGESDGDSVLGFAQAPLDVRAAVQFVYDEGLADGMPVVLLGHSWGGYGVAGALDFPDVRERVAACVAMSGFDSPDEIIFESSENQMGPIAVTQRPIIDLIGRMDFGEDANRSASAAVSSCGLPVMIVQGTEDEVVSFAGSSIRADRDSNQNPLVVYVDKDEPGRDGHNTYFYSPESQRYLNECVERYRQLQDEYGDDVPDDVLADFLASVDKRRANTADPVLIDQIDAFFARATS